MLKPIIICLRCAHLWTPHSNLIKFGRLPKTCPNCKTKKWNIPATENERGAKRLKTPGDKTGIKAKLKKYNTPPPPAFTHTPSFAGRSVPVRKPANSKKSGQ